MDVCMVTNLFSFIRGCMSATDSNMYAVVIVSCLLSELVIILPFFLHNIPFTALLNVMGLPLLMCRQEVPK